MMKALITLLTSLFIVSTSLAGTAQQTQWRLDAQKARLAAIDKDIAAERAAIDKWYAGQRSNLRLAAEREAMEASEEAAGAAKGEARARVDQAISAARQAETEVAELEALREALGVQRLIPAFDMPRGIDLIARDFNPQFTADIPKRIRSAIDTAFDRSAVETVRGIGYRLAENGG